MNKKSLFSVCATLALRPAVFLLVISVASPAGAKTKVTWWQFWTDQGIKPTIDSMIAEFEAANPEIDIEATDLTWGNGHEKIVIALASGTGPDVLEVGADWIAQFAHNGHLSDISDLASADSSAFDGWSMSAYNGKQYAFPWILGTRVIFANRDLLTRATYDTSFYPIDWVKFRTSAKAIDNLGPDIYGWGSNAPEKHRLYKKFLPFFWSNGASIFTPDGRHMVMASTAAIEAMIFYKSLHDTSSFVADQRGIEDAFLAGKVGYVLSGDWLLKRIMLEKPNFPLSTSLVPGPKFPGRSFLGGEFLAINAKSQVRDAAATFIRFVTSPAQQVRFCKANFSATPSSRVAQKDSFFTSNPHLLTFVRQMKLSEHPPVDPDWVRMETIIEEAVEDALFGSKAIAEPLWRAQRKIYRLKTE